jgi:hypothetical protein
LVSAALYSSLLPLWNGFDEPFHYAYVESLAVWHTFPRLGSAPITEEIGKSFALTPTSRFMQGLAPESIPVEQWARLPLPERIQRRAELDELPTDLRYRASRLLNYEAQQAPLMYLLLTPLDAALGRVALRVRILVLRLFMSVGSILLLFVALQRLCRSLELNAEFANAASLCVVATQMLFASIAHIGNDALAIPLTALFLDCLLRAANAETVALRECVLLASVLAFGLITKAYFLAFVPVTIVLVVARYLRGRVSRRGEVAFSVLLMLIAAPWYARNLILYRSLSGTQESVSGIGVTHAITTAAGKIDWLSSVPEFARWCVWTGDWSFISFSKPTVTVELLLMLLGLALYVTRWHKWRREEYWFMSACLCFLAALAYQTCVTWVNSNGAAHTAEPWYAQGIVVAIWVLVFKGFQSTIRCGRIIAGITCIVSAWIALITYASKLPLFYGMGITRASVRNALAFWSGTPTESLAPVVLGPVSLVLSLLVTFILLLFAASGAVVRDLRAGKRY